MSVAVFAGTFDPFTVGHLDIVRRASTHFETLYVSVCPNPGKQLPRFSLEQRLELIRDAVRGIDNVHVAHFEGLLVEHCRLVGADCIVRGIRSGQDVEYERMLESVNKNIVKEKERFLRITNPD